MHIGHVIYSARLSGAEIVVRALCLAQIARGIASSVVSLRASQEDFADSFRTLKAQNVRLHIAPKNLNRVERVQHLWNYANTSRPDVVFAHSTIPSAYSRLVLQRFFNIPTIHVIHSGADDYRDKLSCTLERVFLPAPRAVIAVGDAVKEMYIKHFPLRRIDVVPNGIDLHAFRYNLKDRLKSRRDLLDVPDPATKVILQVGRITPLKGHLRTLEAFNRASDSGRANAVLAFAGAAESGDLERQLQQCITRNGLASRVKILGSRNDIPDLLQCADAFVLPSEYEAQGIALLESLAAGLPGIVSDINAFEFAKAMDGIIATDTMDFSSYSMAIGQLLHLPQGARIQRDLERFSSRTMADRYESIARTILSVT